jgi:ribosomal-protein-alanine N-acetyltransferase
MSADLKLEDIHTHRMRLVPATASLIRAELEDRDALARLLHATLPDEWPPEEHVDALPWFLAHLKRRPDQAGWFAWYGLLRSAGTSTPVLIGSGGFKGPPQEGTVEVGFAVLEPFRRKGYATEMVGALVGWAQADAGVRRVVAETRAENVSSVRVLRKLGFSGCGAGSEPGSVLFELRNESGAGLQPWV